jgi:integrase
MEDILEKQSQNNILSTIDNPRDKALIKLVLDTGLYVNELVNLKVHSVDWVNHVLHIEGKRQREEPLKEETILLLKNWVEKRPSTDKPFLFLTLKGDIDQLSTRGVDRLLRKWGDKNDLSALNFRTLRNTYKGEFKTHSTIQKDPNQVSNNSTQKPDEKPQEKKTPSKLESFRSNPKAIMLLIIVVGFIFNFLVRLLFSEDDQDD